MEENQEISTLVDVLSYSEQQNLGVKSYFLGSPCGFLHQETLSPFAFCTKQTKQLTTIALITQSLEIIQLLT